MKSEIFASSPEKPARTEPLTKTSLSEMPKKIYSEADYRLFLFSLFGGKPQDSCNLHYNIIHS